MPLLFTTVRERIGKFTASFRERRIWKPAVAGVALLLILFLFTQKTPSPHISYSFPDPTSTPKPTQPVSPSPTATATVTVSPSPTAYAAETINISRQDVNGGGNTQPQRAIQDTGYVVQDTDFLLYIPSLNLIAPIIPNVPGDDKTAYNKALENGVAHYAGTRFPGEVGRIFVFGHSSYYRNRPGNYKEIFAPLGNMNEGEKVLVYYGGTEYEYRITSKRVVMPNDMSVLSATDTKTLTLQTCWPPGSVAKRLIIDSIQIRP